MFFYKNVYFCFLIFEISVCIPALDELKTEANNLATQKSPNKK